MNHQHAVVSLAGKRFIYNPLVTPGNYAKIACRMACVKFHADYLRKSSVNISRASDLLGLCREPHMDSVENGDICVLCEFYSCLDKFPCHDRRIGIRHIKYCINTRIVCNFQTVLDSFFVCLVKITEMYVRINVHGNSTNAKFKSQM